MFSVSVSPDMGMYNLLKNQGYETSYALAEYIDNAIHAWQLKHTHNVLKVHIKFYSQKYNGSKKKNSIEIIDNGPGIGRKNLVDAFKPAKKPANKGLSEFGIGMKTASVWFTDKWELTTRPINSEKKYHFEFNLNKLLEAGADTVDIEEKPRKNSRTGTTVFLHDIHKPINKTKYGEICKDLRELYQLFTYGEGKILTLEASFDETPQNLDFTPLEGGVLDAPVFKVFKGKLYSIGKPRKWFETFKFKFKGCQVHGFIQLFSTGSYKNNPGLILFRHNRVISGTTQNPYIPQSLFNTANKYAKQRVYGQVHLDGLPVSYTKDKFEFDDEELTSLMRKEKPIEKLLKQADAYRVRGLHIKISSENDLKTSNESKHGADQSKDSASDSKGQSDKSKEGGNHKDKTNKDSVNFVTILKSLNTTMAVLRDIITETADLYEMNRPVATALCFRIVLETGILYKIESDLPAQYPTVSEKGINSLLNYINGNSQDFFGESEHRAKKCAQSIVNGKQINIVTINNVAHGHYHPSIKELDSLIKNLQPLLEWAYS